MRRRRREEPLRIVAFGGGTGLSILLRGLARLPMVETTAVVAVSDDGGSSGRLREEGDLPAVGDARACLAALAPHDDWARLLEHRFTGAPSLQGHAAGNLLLAAAHERAGTLSASLRLMGRLLRVRGRVLPSTDARPVLVARLADGREIRGEAVLGSVVGPVERLQLLPELVAPGPGVLPAIERADLIVLGPGSLFSSVIASALPAGVARALCRSGVPRLFVQNLTTQRGETDEMGVADHIRAVQEHLGPEAITAALVHVWNGSPPPEGLISDGRALAALGVREITARVATDQGRGRLHDSRLLAQAVYRYAREQVAGARLRSVGR